MSRTKATADRPDALVARDITKVFGGLTALNGVSLRLQRGEILGLIGPNGSGKTTFINVVTGNLQITSGEVWIGDTNITGWPAHKIPYTGVLRTFQVVRPFKALSVMENVEVAAVSLRKLPRTLAKAEAWRALERMGLTRRANLAAGTLPYGEERRMEIARALVAEPNFLLLDEPGAGLNDAEVETLLATLSGIPDDIGCGMLVVDHDMRFIMGLCDRIQVLNFGQTIGEGTPEEVRRQPAVIEAYLGSTAKV